MGRRNRACVISLNLPVPLELGLDVVCTPADRRGLGDKLGDRHGVTFGDRGARCRPTRGEPTSLDATVIGTTTRRPLQHATATTCPSSRKGGISMWQVHDPEGHKLEEAPVRLTP
jgi:hypothetical protein